MIIIGKEKVGEEIVRQAFEEVGLTMLEPYVAFHKNIKCINGDGYYVYTKYTTVKSKKLNFKIFHPTNPYTIDNINHYIKLNNINVELLSKNYVNSSSVLLFKCACGREFKTTLGSFKYQNKTRCDICSRNKPQGEIVVEEWLSHNQINFETQYKTNECKYKYPLSFDFAILDNSDIKAFIEVDGIQHFKPVECFGGEKRFAEQELIDGIKNDYAIRKNIKMIRIPYWEIKNGKYINKLKTLI